MVNMPVAQFLGIPLHNSHRPEDFTSSEKIPQKYLDIYRNILA